jgi:hypothetical protein
MSSTETQNPHSTVQEIGPAVLSELNDCGIKNSSLDVIFDMVSLEDSGKLVEIISKMVKFHKSKFSIKLGIHNWIETTMRFDSKCMECKEPMPEGTRGLWLRGQGVKHIQCVSMYVPLLPASTIFTNENSGIVFDDGPNDNIDFKTRKEMRESLLD